MTGATLDRQHVGNGVSFVTLKRRGGTTQQFFDTDDQRVSMVQLALLAKYELGTKDDRRWVLERAHPKSYDVTKLEPPYFELLYKLKGCPSCDKPMMHLFPSLGFVKLEQQLAAFGGVETSKTGELNGDAVCVECAAEGRVGFDCVICGQTRSSDLLQHNEGRHRFCKLCYDTVSAKTWEAHVAAVSNYVRDEYGDYDVY